MVSSFFLKSAVLALLSARVFADDSTIGDGASATDSSASASPTLPLGDGSSSTDSVRSASATLTGPSSINSASATDSSATVSVTTSASLSDSSASASTDSASVVTVTSMTVATSVVYQCASTVVSCPYKKTVLVTSWVVTTYCPASAAATATATGTVATETGSGASSGVTTTPVAISVIGDTGTAACKKCSGVIHPTTVVTLSTSCTTTAGGAIGTAVGTGSKTVTPPTSSAISPPISTFASGSGAVDTKRWSLVAAFVGALAFL